MFTNYLKIAWRNLRRDSQFTFLNLLGLATGLACTLMIYLWIIDEYKMGKYNAKDDQLFQVMVNLKENGEIHTMEYTAGLLAPTIKAEIPEIQYACTVLPATWFSNQGVLSIENKKIKADGEYVSNDYFDVFSSTFIEGDQNQIFTDNNSVAISESLALKLFGTVQQSVGKTIQWAQAEFGGPFMIRGVFKDNPTHSTRKFDLLFNYSLVLERRPNLKDFGNSDPSTYVVLAKGSDISQVNSKIHQVLLSKSKEDSKAPFLVKYSEKYLYGNYENGFQSGGRITYVKLFSMIALFILILACINFMNLSTAKASHRFKEVGIKKVVGAGRSSLVLQYLSESVLMSLVALVVAIGLIFLLLPVFNQINGKQLHFYPGIQLIGSVLGITVLTGLVAGSYPALYLSGFKPVSILKGNLKTSFSEFFFRRGLVIFQFVVSVVFIAAVLLVHKQLTFIQSKDLGYQRQQLVHFEIPLENDSLKLNAASAFIHELKNIPGVVDASSYYHNLMGDHGGISDFTWPGKDPNQVIDFANLEVGDNFLQTTGIQLTEGRHFSNNKNAHNEIIFNETAIKQMGLKDPVGKMIKFWGMERQIVGVAKDFNFESLYHSVQPCFFQIYPVMPNVLVRLNAGSEKQTINSIQKAFSAFNPGMAFDFKFLDVEYQSLYISEQRISSLSTYFAGLAILISCLGLFGLAAFTAQKRKKEIGIRKVVGASTARLAWILSTDYFKLVAIALCIAFPVIWISMNNWLNGFAYHIKISMPLFIITGSIAVLITVMAVGYQAIRAAIANPMKALRTE